MRAGVESPPLQLAGGWQAKLAATFASPPIYGAWYGKGQSGCVSVEVARWAVMARALTAGESRPLPLGPLGEGGRAAASPWRARRAERLAPGTQPLSIGD